ncbi:HDIG domain-containing protein [Mycoplasma sp. T363T]|uniref:Ribonuclease Y n=1 Tax=Mycoplasma bradburyae TaxID=2963128 RepID=A0AAW6HQZ3_9MOLU|nr:HDIG domain-containing metalloprotein [Mycoplasma bradburyae]MDC4163470.1 HDIG domain-containing protein [Mycoplasma bradburyae]MDC4182071.1 HDIG domain-containing protein [Mycoplasma bradburyae]MDC4182844.1 HDIG domain-containing protein [Mycoplasma bradburyae]MDC4183518.1 HDIG domain-containing protein [Mycoplasma bradburyae]UTS69854.1 HDIG domain-containing protein [Mycoplasma bradburyae]
MTNISLDLMYLIVALLTALALLLFIFILLKFFEFRFLKETENHQRELENEIIKINKQDELKEKLNEHYLFQDDRKMISKKEFKEIKNFFISVLSEKILIEERNNQLNEEIKDKRRENSLLKKRIDSKKIEEKIAMLKEMKINEEEARKFILDEYRIYVRNDLEQMIKEEEKRANVRKNEIANEINKILINAMNSTELLAKTVRVTTKRTINYQYNSGDSEKDQKVTNDFYSKLIGKDGKTKAYIETLYGIKLDIDSANKKISLSCFNAIKLTIAERAINKIISIIGDDKIHYLTDDLIKKCYYETLNEFTAETKKIGEEVLQELDLYDSKLLPNKDICEYIGRLKFRGSNTQMVLEHSIETAQLAANIASQLGLNVEKAKLCGLLHDIGKSINHEENWKKLKYSTGNHVAAGVAIAKYFDLDIDIIDAINCHHGNPKLYEKSKNFYAKITQIADKISASRPGARYKDGDDDEKRADFMTDLLNKHKHDQGIANYKILKNGFDIQIMIQPNISDQDFKQLILDIKKDIQNHHELSKYSIKLTCIRNLTVVENTKSFASISLQKSNDYAKRFKDADEDDDLEYDEELKTTQFID